MKGKNGFVVCLLACKVPSLPNPKQSSAGAATHADEPSERRSKAGTQARPPSARGGRRRARRAGTHRPSRQQQAQHFSFYMPKRRGAKAHTKGVQPKRPHPGHEGGGWSNLCSTASPGKRGSGDQPGFPGLTRWPPSGASVGADLCPSLRVSPHLWEIPLYLPRGLESFLSPSTHAMAIPQQAKARSDRQSVRCGN